jgi:anti-sigma regulatory factor (Ser/Thr protein kinase)
MEVYLKVLVPSHPRFLSVVRAVVGELGSVFGFPDEECRGMVLAVDEAMANVIRHAYRSDFDQPVEVNCRAWPDRLEFTLLDQGVPPDPARICAQPLDDSALGGRGTHLMRMIMDEVIYERVPGGNQLRMTKRLTAPGDDGEGKGNNT